jgi:hypothetical protein
MEISTFHTSLLGIQLFQYLIRIKASFGCFRIAMKINFDICTSQHQSIVFSVAWRVFNQLKAKIGGFLFKLLITEIVRHRIIITFQPICF